MMKPGKTNRTITIAMAAAALALLATSMAAAPQIPALEPASGANIAEVTDNIYYSRAVNAAIWGMPLVNFDAMRQAYFRDAGARYDDVIYFSRFANWKFQTTTPNNSTNYVMFFCNLKNGPVVVDVPAEEEAALYGSIVNSWTEPLMDVGNNGHDKGKGAKYLLLPPGYNGAVPAGCVPVDPKTFNLYALLRVIPKSNSKDDLAKAIAYLHKLKIYPLGNPGKKIRYIDVYDKPFEGIAPFDAGYFASLARMVKEEPVLPQDLGMMGLMHTIGVGKNTDFNPTAAQETILERAIQDAHAHMINGFATTGIRWWKERNWLFLPTMKMVEARGTAMLPDRELVDDRSFLYYGVFGPVKNALPNLYVKTFFDADGVWLNGSNTYKLNVPANIPTTQFWSAIAQDNETAGFIRGAKSVGVNSYQNLKKNPDGSVDIYFSAQAPEGREDNWVSTTKGKNFFILFRNYGATPEVLKRTSPWTLNNVEKVK